MKYRQRFGLKSTPIPKDAKGKTFFEETPAYKRLERAFRRLTEEPGLGIVDAESGVGKTAAMRNLCGQLPKPDYLVVYICDTAVSPLDLYRTLAVELGVTPSHRRSLLWTDIKKSLLHLVDERGTAPVVVVDEAQHLSDRFLLDLSGFLNFCFDSRDILTLWLVGLPGLRRTLAMQQHAALASRIVASIHLDPLGHELFDPFVRHALSVAGATEKILGDQALELLFRASRGIPRNASRILRTALILADERGQSFIDDSTMEAAVDDLSLALPDVA